MRLTSRDIVIRSGTLIQHDRDDNLTRLAEGIAMAGLPPVLFGSATDESFDAAIEASTDAGGRSSATT